MNTKRLGAISALWRFPVKSMLGEQLATLDLTDSGVLGDRAYALVDLETGKVVSAKSTKLFPDVLACQAAFVESPQLGEEFPAVLITLPNGSSLTSDSRGADSFLSEFFKRKVTLARTAPADFTIDMYHPDLGELQADGPRDTVMDQKLGSALYAELGLPSAVPAGSFFDCYPISILSTSTLSQLSDLRPESQFDQRRFRMNLIVDSIERGFIENSWVGHDLRIGNSAELSVAVPDSRCVMTTLAQAELPKDIEILRTLARHNKIQVGTSQVPCAGVYATVKNPGLINVGDQVLMETN